MNNFSGRAGLSFSGKIWFLCAGGAPSDCRCSLCGNESGSGRDRQGSLGLPLVERPAGDLSFIELLEKMIGRTIKQGKLGMPVKSKLGNCIMLPE